MASEEELYHYLSNYPIDLPPQPPQGAYPHFIHEATTNLIENILFYERDGLWSKVEYRWVELSNIEHTKVWRPESLIYAEKQIDCLEPLQPVHLFFDTFQVPNIYTINDGIYRIQALRNKSFTHVLAVVEDDVHDQPSLPPNYNQYYDVFKKKFLDNEAAGYLGDAVNQRPVFLLSSGSEYSNDVKFSVLRVGVDLSNVKSLPPDCELKVTDLGDNDKIRATGKMFGNEVDYSGTIEEVSESIKSYNIHQIGYGILEDETDSLSEEEKFHANVEKHLRESGAVDRYLACLVFLGLPASGKTTLIARLLNLPVSEDSESTGIMDGVITVNLAEDDATLCVASIDENWGWEKVELGLSCLRQMGIQCFARKQDFKKGANQQEAEDGKVLKKHTPIPTAKESMPDQPTAEPPQDGMKILSEVLKKYGFSEIRHYLDKRSTLYLSDTGGQIEFQELLPLLVAGLAIFVFLFPLNEDLDKPVTVSYRKKVKDGAKEDKVQHSNVYTSSLTIKESLLQTLSSIDSMEGSVDPSKPKHKHYTFLVGTHKDCLIKELGESGAVNRIAEINHKMKELIIEHKYDDLVVYPTKDEVFFAVDNTCQNATFSKIKKAVMELLHGKSQFRIQFPISYLLASLHLQENSKPFIKRSDFAKDVLQYGIKEEDLEYLLHFLHHRISQIRYFPLDEELKEVLVKEPQALYNLVTDLITKSFLSQSSTGKEHSEVEKGIYSLDYFSDEEFLSQSEFLTPELIIHLLKELRIVAPFYDQAAGVEKYFIPCILNHLPESLEDDPHRASIVQSLAIMFACGHCPKGIFGVLLHYILTELKWILDIKKILRDKVSFKVGPHSEVTIKLHPAYLEVRYSPTGTQHDQILTLKNVCNKIRSTLESGIEPVRKSLNYSQEKMEYKLGLVCAECCQPHEVLEEHSMQCPKQESCSLPNSGSFWFAIPTYFFPELSGMSDTVIVTRGCDHQIKFSVDSDTLEHKLSKEGSSLRDSNVYLECATNTVYFKDVWEADEGMYVISSSNSVGKGHVSFRLKIRPPPIYCLQDDYLEAEVGSSPTLTFTMTSDPPLAENTEHTLLKSDGSRAPRRFKVESSHTAFRKVIEEDSHGGQDTRKVKVESGHITFRNLKEADSGEYTISCYNTEGNKIEATLELEITPPTPQDHGTGKTHTAARICTLVESCHYSVLVEQLVPCQAEWESIAEGLGFLGEEIAAIKKNPIIMNDGPKGCLREVLNLWIRWAPGDARKTKDVATLEALRAAVKKAGYPKVADKLTLRKPR